MFRRILIAAAVLGLASALAGCQGNREMEAEVQSLKNSTKNQFGLLKQQNEFLNRKVNTLNEKIENLTQQNTRLSEELATYANRPDEVRIEIINEVNTRFAGIAKAQEEFKEAVRAQLQEKSDEVDNRLDTEFAAMNAVLDKHTAFVKFVSTEQDSINRVFANRMDNRPWYQSIIGKWEDRERAAKESELP